MSRNIETLEGLVAEPRVRRRLTPLVLVHGRRTNPAELLESLRGPANEAGLTLIAPDFTQPAFAGYQSLAGVSGPLVAAEALNGLLARVGRERGLETSRIDCLGFSGGAQFAHRYALAFPERVRRLILAAPGWYTFPDPEVDYPAGLKGFRWPRGVAGVEAFLDIPTLVAVGSRDLNRGANLRTSAEIDAQQGYNRHARASRWCARLREESARRNMESQLEQLILTDVGHDWREMIREGDFARSALEFLTRKGPVRTGR